MPSIVGNSTNIIALVLRSKVKVKYVHKFNLQNQVRYITYSSVVA